MNLNQETDEILMNQAAQGNHLCLEQLLKRYGNMLMTFLQRMSRNEHRSGDLFQEVCLAVWRYRHTYKYPQKFKVWLFRIALNVYRSQFRRRLIWFLPFETEDDNPWEPSSNDPPPDEKAVATETACIVSEAVRQLPSQQRTVVTLRVWSGLSYAEIARVIDCRESTVRSHMFHALVTMKEFLEPRLR